MRRLLCAAFGHRRDGKRARPSHRGWRAPCLNCGEHLLRVAPGEWLLDEDAIAFIPATAGSAAYPARRAPVSERPHEANENDEAPRSRERRSQ